MDAGKISDRTRQQLDLLPPESRAKAEALIARTLTPEYRSHELQERKAIEREFLERGLIQATSASEVEGIQALMKTLRREREAEGLSLADLAGRIGVDATALSRLEDGEPSLPTLLVLSRYARALGKNLRWTLEDVPARSVS